MFILAVTASVANFFTYYHAPLYSDLLKFEFSIFVLFLITSFSTIETRRGIGSSNRISWFSSTSPPDKTTNLTLIFGLFLLLVGLSGIIGNYTKNIFPHIPQSFGGGQLEKIRYKTEKEIFEGEKIYETKENVFLLKGDSIRRIEWAEIKIILPASKKESVDSFKVPFIMKIK